MSLYPFYRSYIYCYVLFLLIRKNSGLLTYIHTYLYTNLLSVVEISLAFELEPAVWRATE